LVPAVAPALAEFFLGTYNCFISLPVIPGSGTPILLSYLIEDYVDFVALYNMLSCLVSDWKMYTLIAFLDLQDT
jgi:hypothetical protein